MKLSSLTPLLATALGLLVTACQREAAAPPKPKQAEAVPIVVATVTNVAWDRTVSIIGTLYPKDSATIAAQIDGQVTKTLVDFGDRVTNGQDIAYLDVAPYQAQLTQQIGILARAEATLANARINLTRVEALRKSSVSSESDYDLAKVAVEQAEAELKTAQGAKAAAELNVQRARVTAPFDGGISQRIATPGDYLKVGESMFQVVNDGVLKFIFAVPERYGSLVQKGLPVRFGVDNYPGETFTGSVYLISPEVTLSSRTFNVGALVTNTNFRLKASTFARGTITVEKAVPTPVVPLESVVSFAGVTKVFIVRDGKVEGRTVKLGRARDGLQEITEGLAVGEQVAQTGLNKLFDGTAVTLQTAADAPKETSGKVASATNTNAGGAHERK